MLHMETRSERQARVVPYVRAWLGIVAFLIFCMVIVGGATRLTDSGLSITEWKLLLGVIPPLSEADWNTAFEKYKLIPEARIINAGMTLAAFKVIYWWEWSHRFLGRIIGVVYFLPLVFFFANDYVETRLRPRLMAILALGAFQGGLGWYMVVSGLTERVDVSQYRLAAHLTLAAIIFSAVLWVAFGLQNKRRLPLSERERVALVIPALVLLQIAAGGFVAGLDAGMGYNTWPLMEGQLIPSGLYSSWRDAFENAMTVQFNHRALAYGIAVLVAGYAYVIRTREAVLILVVVLLQIGFGVWTLLWQVPLWLGLAHQGGAFLVLAAALWNLHVVLSRSLAPDRR